ncbi:MAG TPA: exodeoxyribonuclease V subunit gamma [Acidimicrobiales bacterium]|nr:exodeoxyribonuclease V subunit gamma [Acidimicrobiales bacterium]
MLQVVRSERADGLVDALADLLSVPPADPIAPEVVAVPTRGVERWLAQRLAGRLGVCANVDMPSPGALVRRATAAALGVDPDSDPWRPDALLWPLVDVIDEHVDDPALATLAEHLRAAAPRGRPGEPAPPVRRLEVARALVERFERYGLDRPAMVRGWVAGGGGWQGHLWRLLRGRLGEPSPAERTSAAAACLRDDPALVALPERLGCFGLTRLPPAQLDVLAALGAGRDVRLYLLHPSSALWEEVAAALPTPPRGLRRVADSTARLAAHPLLRSWGRDARELQLVIGATGADDSYRPPVAAAAPTLLGRLQADIRADRPPPADARGGPGERIEVGPAESSLQVHACHGRARQVEVLRDAIAHLLAADPTIELRDVIVMCPDIEAFAPLVHAAFGPVAGGEADGRVDGAGRPRLAVRLADRSLRQTNPLLAVAEALLDLAGGRVGATEVLGLAARPPVARRFRLDRDDLATLERWVGDAGVRWGLDASWRRPWKLDGVAEGTWRAGLDRLLLGVAMEGGADCRGYGDVVPLDAVASSAIDLVGRITELVSRVGVALHGLQGRRPAVAWLQALASGVRLLAEAAPDEAWQGAQLARERAEAAAGLGAADGGRPGPDLGLDEVRHLLADRLRGRPTRAGFRTGDLTVCTLVPMRSVPHRVVALLGLDDGAFPRHPPADGDDLLADDPHVGDRDARAEDRQLLLDAVMAATDAVVITYSGRDERTNRRRPPAVPVAELLDVVDAMATGPEGSPAREVVVTEHPLQPHDPRCFLPAPGRGPWSFDRVQLAGARAAAAPLPPRPFLDAPLPPLADPVVQLDAIVGFVEHPVRSFLRRRFGLWLLAEAEPPPDALQTELDPLERWGVGQRLLDAALAGTSLERAAAAERARGYLPPGPLAGPVLAEAAAEVERLLAALGDAAGPADSLDVHLELADGRRLVGTVPRVRGSRLVSCTYSRLGPKHRLAAWVRHLALCAGRPEIDSSSVLVGRGQGRAGPARIELPPIPGAAAERAATALRLLAEVVDLYDRGSREPLPLCCSTSEAWAAATVAGLDRDEVWRRARDCWHDEWRDGDRWAREQSDRDHVEVWGPGTPLEALYALPAAPDEAAWPTLAQPPTSRLAVLALRLWRPVLAAEVRR